MAHRSQSVMMCFQTKFVSRNSDPCVICLALEHGDTKEIPYRSICCNVSQHLPCIYQWLQSLNQHRMPWQNWACPHCRRPVYLLNHSREPCFLCQSLDIGGEHTFTERLPCCSVTLHNTCLYQPPFCGVHDAWPPWRPISPTPLSTWTMHPTRQDIQCCVAFC